MSNKVETLLAAGRMREPGKAEVRAAQADGRWDAAYESQKHATAPPDVVAALAENEEAKNGFDSLSKTAQYRLYLPRPPGADPEGTGALAFGRCLRRWARVGRS